MTGPGTDAVFKVRVGYWAMTMGAAVAGVILIFVGGIGYSSGDFAGGESLGVLISGLVALWLAFYGFEVLWRGAEGDSVVDLSRREEIKRNSHSAIEAALMMSMGLTVIPVALLLGERPVADGQSDWRFIGAAVASAALSTYSLIYFSRIFHPRYGLRFRSDGLDWRDFQGRDHFIHLESLKRAQLTLENNTVLHISTAPSEGRPTAHHKLRLLDYGPNVRSVLNRIEEYRS